MGRRVVPTFIDSNVPFPNVNNLRGGNRDPLSTTGDILRENRNFHTRFFRYKRTATVNMRVRRQLRTVTMLLGLTSLRPGAKNHDTEAGPENPRNFNLNFVTGSGMGTRNRESNVSP